MEHSQHFELAHVECVQFGPQRIIPQRMLTGGNRLMTVRPLFNRPLSDLIFRGPVDEHTGEERYVALATVTILTITAFGESKYIPQLILTLRVAERTGLFDEVLGNQHSVQTPPLSVLGFLIDKRGVDQICAPYRDDLLGVAERLLDDAGGFASFITLWRITTPGAEVATHDLSGVTADLVGFLEMTSEHLVHACRWRVT